MPHLILGGEADRAVELDRILADHASRFADLYLRRADVERALAGRRVGRQCRMDRH